LDCIGGRALDSLRPASGGTRFVAFRCLGRGTVGSDVIVLVRSSSGVALAGPGTMCRRARGPSARFVGRALRPGGVAGGRFRIVGLALRVGLSHAGTSIGSGRRGAVASRRWAFRQLGGRRMQSNYAFKPTAGDGLSPNRLHRPAAA